MTTAKELAARLDGREYGSEITPEEAKAAEEAGLVVVFGYSDDNVELRGAITDEVSAYNGATVYLDGAKVLENDCEDEQCPHFIRAQAKAPRFKARWSSNASAAAWTFDVTWPHATFRVNEDGEPFCDGVVFALSDAASRGAEAGR